jgi:SpoVK/Ycf46/Vps4 family AAA+-type ATPase
LREFEFGGNGQIYAQNDRRLVELSKYGLDAGTYIAELDKTSYTVFEVEFGKDDNYEVTYRIWFIGKKWKKHRDEFMKVVQEYRDIKKEERHETIRYTNGNPPIDAVFKPFDKVVFTGKEHLLNYIDNFIKNIPEYYRYGMTPKLSIMLHGEPGTGKSTVARALANYLNIPSITSVSPDYFEADNNDNNKNSRFRATRFYEKTVWVLDDCDCICKSREDDDSVENTKILSSLLSFLDNPPTIDYEARDGIIYPIALVVATTNYYDRLDAAVKRHGRFDLTIEMKEFNREEADEMCAIYSLKLEDVLPKKEIDVKNFRISPSKLQAICLENIDKSMKSVG